MPPTATTNSGTPIIVPLRSLSSSLISKFVTSPGANARRDPIGMITPDAVY